MAARPKTSKRPPAPLTRQQLLFLQAAARPGGARLAGYDWRTVDSVHSRSFVERRLTASGFVAFLTVEGRDYLASYKTVSPTDTAVHLQRGDAIMLARQLRDALEALVLEVKPIRCTLRDDVLEAANKALEATAKLDQARLKHPRGKSRG